MGGGGRDSCSIILNLLCIVNNQRIRAASILQHGYAILAATPLLLLFREMLMFKDLQSCTLNAQTGAKITGA